jgi:PAS domain S-box-containing protein
MSKSRQTRKSGQAEIERLQRRLSELEETLRAIRGGEVDALIVSEGAASRVYTLQGAEHPYRVMVEAMNEGSATLTNDGIILFANPRLMEMLGTGEEELIGKSLRDLIKYIDCDNIDDLLKLIEKKPTKVECTLHVKGDGALPVYLSFSPLKENGFSGVCLIVTDLSGQKRREEQLAQANESLRTEVSQRLRAEEALRQEEESLRQLSARLLMLQDEERRRIARDLHESTGQKVAALCLDLTLATRQADLLPPSARDTLQHCSALAEEITTDIRTLSYLLHPPLLDEVGLRSAARWYVDGFTRRSKIEVNLDLPSRLPRMHQDVEIALFRILQESLNNVHRHSGSKVAHVTIASSDHSVTLQVEDKGRPTAQQSQRLTDKQAAMLGVGIRGMRERVRQLGGKLEIHSTHNGTTIKATLPLRSTREQRESA